MKKLFAVALVFLTINSKAQLKVGNNPNTIDPNSLLELESTNKGFLPPRVALNSTASVAPLTGTVPSGMLVYSIGGSLVDGYYYWNGTQWKLVATSELNVVTKSASATLLKTETCVLGSNDITLTLPAITASDNGLAITVKNAGSHTDLVTVQGNGGATIDDLANSNLTRYVSQTYVAAAGNWIIKNKTTKSDNLLEVSANSSWTTLEEVVEFLEAHMAGPTVVRLGEETYDISSTITIDLDYPITFQGMSYGTATIAPASGLAGSPMFRCLSDVFFKMLNFDATILAGYGSSAGEDAIRLLGSGSYNEVKDCMFDGFYNTILDSVDAELWVFETDISNSYANGIKVHGNIPGVILKVAETDFIGCNVGVNLSKATNATVQLASGGYYNSGGTAILYQPASFSFANISITGNSWNNSGNYIMGFDFTRTDGRDKNAIIESNAGMGDQRPNCFINVINSSTTKTLTNANTWYVADWGSNTSSETCKWTIVNNRITYQPTNRRNGVFSVTGNLSVSSTNQNISIAIVKNGNSAVRYGETTLRVTTADQPFQFSFLASLDNIGPGDYFEIYYSNASTSNKQVKIQDIQWLANTQ
jgi:hypothetical protein